uniref:Ribonuclease H-like domain-containing protein n=1 Tax=Tanacetum cinerariifolium TaxID=118510 RepID=A0A6L2KIM4_TANCI|nr:ribonuclease H-like domain-containing protein [Tanacetum cinerariifolium]
MSTQQDIYVAGSENRPPMLNKDNYVPWSSRIIRYARSRPNGKMIVDSIENVPYVRRMIATPREPGLPVPVPESFNEQTDEELTETDIKRMDADDQAIQTILLGLPEDVYAAVDSCETATEIWERVRKMMKGSDIEEHDKKAKLINEWEMMKGIVNPSGTGNVVATRAEGTRIRKQAMCYNYRGLGHIARNCTARPRRRDAAYLQTQLFIAQKEETGIQLQAEEFDFMAAAGDLDKI